MRNHINADFCSSPREGAAKMSFTGFIRRQIEHLTACERFGTARNYRRALSSLCTFNKGRELAFGDFDALLVERYDAWLARRGLVRNSVSFYMRILRSLYDKAVRENFAVQTFPFRNVYTGVDRTGKRAVDERTISSLLRLELTQASLAMARDIFMFSFYTRGMAFVDIAYLRKCDIRDGEIRYSRRKTSQPLSIRIEPCIGEIMARYADGSDRSPYVFPILRGSGAGERYRSYQTALNYYNRLLGRLSSMLGPDVRLTTYTARHSWATIARRRNVPLSVISEGMGHASERTTRIYLAAIDGCAVDDANRLVMQAVGGIGS